jgi:hypothetical protein
LHCIFIQSIDGNDEIQLGRFVNDNPRKIANCIAKIHCIQNVPHILLFAAQDIPVGTELRYDYGGGDLPWRKVSNFIVHKH